MKPITFFVPGDPVPQDRPRACTIAGKIRMYDPKTSVDWKKVVAQVASLQFNRWCGEGALQMTLHFHLPMSDTMRKKCKTITPQHTKKPDLDNLAKAIKDALSGICYKDDCQIVALILEKEYAATNQNTGVCIFIEDV